MISGVRRWLAFQRKGPLSRDDRGSRFQRESPLTRDGEVEQLPEFQREAPLPKVEGMSPPTRGIVPRQMGWDHYQCSRRMVHCSRLKGMDQYQNLRERFQCSGVRVCVDFWVGLGFNNEGSKRTTLPISVTIVLLHPKYSERGKSYFASWLSRISFHHGREGKVEPLVHSGRSMQLRLFTLWWTVKLRKALEPEGPFLYHLFLPASLIY